jgi:RNA polymerase sigma-70 factor (ECF subfamily)
VKTWAFSIATRVAAGHFRQPGHRAGVIDPAESTDVIEGEPAIDQRLVVNEMNACLRHVIDSLQTTIARR